MPPPPPPKKTLLTESGPRKGQREGAEVATREYQSTAKDFCLNVSIVQTKLMGSGVMWLRLTWRQSEWREVMTACE